MTAEVVDQIPQEPNYSLRPDQIADFEALYNSRRNVIFGFVVDKVHNPDSAEDITQETFLKAMRFWNQFQGVDTGRRNAWLNSIAYNALIDSTRDPSATKELPLLGYDNYDLGFGGISPSAEREVLEREKVNTIWEAVNTLPQMQARALNLTYRQDRTGEEAAEILGKSHVALRALTRRGRLNLEQNPVIMEVAGI